MFNVLAKINVYKEHVYIILLIFKFSFFKHFPGVLGNYLLI